MGKTGYQVIVPPAYSGVALLFCWVYLMFYATSAGIEAAAPISLYSAAYTLSAVCMTVTLVAIAFIVRPRTAFLTSVGAKIATGVGLPVGTALLILHGASFSMPLLIVGAVVTGVFSGILSMQWVAAYKRVGLRVAVSSFPMLMALSVGICATIMYLPREMLALVTIVLPLVSEFLFHDVRKEPWPFFEDEEAGAPDRPLNFTLMLLPFAVYALSTGFLDYSADDNSYTFVFYAFGAFVPVVIAGVYLFVIEREHFVAAFVVPCAVLVAVCVPFLAMSNVVPLLPFVSIGELGIEVLLFVVPIGFAHFFSLDALKTYALGRVVYVVFNAVGWYIAQFAAAGFGTFMHSQVSLVIILIGVEVLTVCLIIAIVKAQKIMPGDDFDAGDALEGASADEANGEERGAGMSSETLADGGDAPSSIDASAGPTSSERAAFVEPCATTVESLYEEYGLSRREREVCMLLARGYTSPRIQKELYISAGTVNYHSRNIYAKLGVHSKQELIALFEGLSQS